MYTVFGYDGSFVKNTVVWTSATVVASSISFAVGLSVFEIMF